MDVRCMWSISVGVLRENLGFNNGDANGAITTGATGCNRDGILLKG